MKRVQAKFKDIIEYNNFLKLPEEDIISFLIKNDDIINPEDTTESSILYWASFEKKPLVVKWLINEKGFIVKEKNRLGHNALNFACAKDSNFEVVKVLIEHGIGFEYENIFDANVLHYVCEHDAKLENVRFLNEYRINLNSKNNHGANALHYACKSNADIKVIKYLVRNNVDINAEDILGANALNYACKYNANIEVINYLFSKRISAGFEDNCKYNALHYACKNNTNIEIIKLLAEKIDLKMKIDNKDFLQFVCKYSASTEIIDFFVNKGLDLKVKDSFQNTLLHLACSYSPEPHIIKYLIKQGVDFSQRNEFKRTALDMLKNATKLSQSTLKKISDFLNAAKYADKLMSKKLIDFKSPFLESMLDEETKEIIIEHIKLKLQNLNLIKSSEKFCKSYVEIATFLTNNIKFIIENNKDLENKSVVYSIVKVPIISELQLLAFNKLPKKDQKIFLEKTTISSFMEFVKLYPQVLEDNSGVKLLPHILESVTDNDYTDCIGNISDN